MALDAVFRMLLLGSRYTTKHHELYEIRSMQAVSFLRPTKAVKKPTNKQTKFQPKNNQPRLVLSTQAYPISSTGLCLGLF